MAKLKVYQYDKCSTCKKALQYLKKKGVEFEAVDITTSPPTKSELKKMLGHLSGDLRRLFNTSGVAYREMKLSEKLPHLSEEEAVGLLASNGRLVKRPFVLTPQAGLVGFREEEWNKTLR